MPSLSERLTAYYRDARLRARRRRSPWNILLFPLSFGGWAAAWYAMFRLVWTFHAAVYPEHQLAQFWQRGISTGSFVPSFLMVFALVPAAMALGFMFANVVLWLIPPARRTLDGEARGYAGTSFGASMRALGRIFIWSAPIGLAIALAAAYGLASLR